jgi:hypothetical protein
MKKNGKKYRKKVDKKFIYCYCHYIKKTKGRLQDENNNKSQTSK